MRHFGSPCWTLLLAACSSARPGGGGDRVSGGGTSPGGATSFAGAPVGTGGAPVSSGAGGSAGAAHVGGGGSQTVGFDAGSNGGRSGAGGDGEGGRAGSADGSGGSGTASGGNAGSGGGAGNGGSAGATATTRYGFTLDAVGDLTDIVASLQALPKRALVRIVFDYPTQPSAYASAVPAIAQVADIVGQPSDSSYTKSMNVAEYSARFEAYVSAFPQIDLWEACNECNGAWAGPNTAAQADAAYDVIKAHGKSVLYTPYWNNPGCADSNGDYLIWTRQKLSDKLKQGADLVAVSIYGMDCTGAEPTYGELNSMFAELGAIFPRARLGIGEYGASKSADKERILRYYLDYRSGDPRYVFWGGYWYGHQDFVPSSKPLWQVFAGAMK